MNLEEIKQYLAPHQIEAYEYEKRNCDVFSLNDVYKRPAPYKVDCTEIKLVFFCVMKGHNYEFEMTFIMPIEFTP